MNLEGIMLREISQTEISQADQYHMISHICVNLKNKTNKNRLTENWQLPEGREVEIGEADERD